MSRPFRLLKVAIYLIILGFIAVAAAAGGVWWYLVPQLPSIDVLKDVRLQVPLRVYTRDQRLMAEFGEKRRDPVRMRDVPLTMVQAVLAAEDDRFYQHPGVDWQGLVRAGWQLLRTGKKEQGGSTITMQVARNFFLGREKTYIRKLNEILLSLRIEQALAKDEILELYLNKIYLGQRAYGVGAASQVYYGKPLSELSVAQMAMIAGLPKAPSRYNPIADPERALARRSYVLRRMHELGKIDEDTYRQAVAEPVTARLHGLAVEAPAPYLGEMVRAYMVQLYGEGAYTHGYSVYTTLDARLQSTADCALRRALSEYDERHGYRGPEGHVDAGAAQDETAWRGLLAGIRVIGGLAPAGVLEVDEHSALVFVRGLGEVQIPWQGIAWARPYIDENHRGPKPKRVADVLAQGDIVRVRMDGNQDWRLAQVPAVEGALVSLDPEDGAIVALSGGFDFQRSKFNRVVQARRQPGSNFKPFIYSAALEHGFTPASLINDAPVVFDDPGLESAWRPENYSGKFFGPTRLRVALMKSRNLVSIRLLRAIGVDTALEYVQRFGFDPGRLPHNLSLALGSASIAPLELVRGYAVFANGGFLVEPYFVDRVIGARGEVIFSEEPLRACPLCEEQAEAAGAKVPEPAPDENMDAGQTAGGRENEASAEPGRPAQRVITAQNDYLMLSLMRDVIRHGTGRRAMRLGRNDLAGKTGTTNEQRDAWFSGFNAHLVTTTWVGFDKLEPLGGRETGGRAALPMWIAYMGEALRGVAEAPLKRPKGLVTVRIDPKTGLLAGADFSSAIFETFREENVPKRSVDAKALSGGDTPAAPEGVTEQLF